MYTMIGCMYTCVYVSDEVRVVARVKRLFLALFYLYIIALYVCVCVCVCLSTAWGNLANVLNAQGKSLDAELAYKSALGYRSNMADVHYNLWVIVRTIIL